MQKSFIISVIHLITFCSATLSGPYIFWGHKQVGELQPTALLEANEEDFANLYKDAKAIVIFVRNSTNRLDASNYPKFQQLMHHNLWTYLPQQYLKSDPVNYNANIEIINLNGDITDEDEQLINGYNDATTIYGAGEVLGIFANHEEGAHYLSKREAKSDEDEFHSTTTDQPLTDETDESFEYLAEGKAILSVKSAPILNINGSKESIKLVEHNKAITFDNQKAKGYGRLNIIFSVNGEKLFLRFNFTLKYGTWSMRGCEVEFKEYKSILSVVGNAYDVPSAPIGFSYRCSARPMTFTNGNDTLVITDYQLQPWLNGAKKFGDVYDCIGFTTSPILAGVLVSLFLSGILSIGIIALLDIKTPNRFESSRSKQLTFTVQE